jgi:tagaturonate reductase
MEPPLSFPGKMLAFLYERYKAFNGSKASGMLILPTELITDNGSKLESIVLELAHLNQLEFKFIEWLESQNTFCNSLVDRIVPGKPNEAECKQLESSLGYHDELLIKTEVFRLWAIEGDERVKDILSFQKADDAVVITPDIGVYKELKLRLLNGTHSFNCGMAFLAGFNLTRDALDDKLFSGFIQKLVYDEISGSIPYEIDPEIKKEFASKVLDRFGNPFIDHQWLSITVQYTAKMKARNIPLLLNHFSINNTPPICMSVCFAGFILFMKSVRGYAGKYYGERNGVEYEIIDEDAEFFHKTWNSCTPEKIARVVLSNTQLWEIDLSLLPGFLHAVQASLLDMIRYGVSETVKRVQTNYVSLNEA